MPTICHPELVYFVNRRVRDLYSLVIPNHVTLSLPKGRFGISIRIADSPSREMLKSKIHAGKRVQHDRWPPYATQPITMNIPAGY